MTCRVQAAPSRPVLPDGQFGVVIADPPWRFQNWSKKGEAKNALRKYDCMSREDLQALPVADVCRDDAVLFMWTTPAFLAQGVDLLDRWGFTYKTAGAWAKQSSTGNKWAFGTGYIFRNAAEFYLVGTRGKPKKRDAFEAKRVRNLIVAPVAAHSEKPDNLHRDAMALYPGPYLELFARRARDGWTTWGNELPYQPAPAPARGQNLDATV